MNALQLENTWISGQLYMLIIPTLLAHWQNELLIDVHDQVIP